MPPTTTTTTNPNPNPNPNPNRNEAPNAPGPPPGFIPFQIPTPPHSPLYHQVAAFLTGELAEAMDTPLVPFDIGIDGPPSDHGSQSSASDAGSDTDTDTELCTLCSRRQKRVRYVACGHRTCASCTKKLWWSVIRRPGRARDPWPACVPCPFCRAAVTAVVDEGGVGSVVTAGGAAASGVSGGLGVAGGGEGVLIVDWMLARSTHALWRLRLETAERVVVDGEGRAWDGGEMSDWNEFFFD